jgi:hypothetical protein
MVAGGSMEILTTTANNIGSFAYREIPVSGSTPKKMVYYCSSATGRIYARTVAPANTSPAEEALAWASSTVKCTGQAMLYNSSRNSLIFPIEQNGLSAIAEYFL